MLFGTQSGHGIFFCRIFGGEQAAQHGDQNAEQNQETAVSHGQGHGERGCIQQTLQDGVDGDGEQSGDQHPQCSGQAADDEGFGIEYLGDIPFGSTHGPENTDLLGALHDGNVGDDADP